MSRAILSAAIIVSCAAAAVGNCPQAASLEEGFSRPPMSARPQTWWHWMNGNVSKEGITADLEAMREIGLGGATLFDAGLGVPAGRLKFASAEWFDHVKHAAAEARRLGLELCLPNCSGWSSSGGPWNPVENSMKELVRAEARFTGPRHVREKLPPLPNAHGFAADIAVVAVPVPPAELATMEKAGGVVTAPSSYVREISFPEPFAADGLFFRLEHDWLWEVAGDVKVEISEDGKRYSELMSADATLAMRAGWDRTERYRPFPREVKARFYRLTFGFRVIGRDPGDHERLKNTRIASVRVGRAKSLSGLCDKTFAKRMPVVADPDTAADDQVVARDAVRVLALAADGTLDWDVPAGEWRVIRLGFASNGKKNHPASDCGGGFEVDKLSPAAVDYHFEQYAAKLVRHLGPLAGDVPSGLAGILVDSYEIGAQNWTQGFELEFSRRRGYDMTPYLPVLAGVVVGSVDESERFLSDFRRTVADLFVEGYSGALARKCHQYGLKLWLEPYGNCPCDDLEYGDEVDVPMCEFWSRTSGAGRYAETGNAQLPGYLAHVWGRRYVGAEAFTAVPPSGGRWTTTPFALKAQGDRAFAKGVNRLVFHRFCHQPFVKPGAFAAPGFTLGIYGIHLDRTQTWWKQGRPYMDYLARCQWMLQEGRNVADILFWHGEEAPSRGGHVVGFPKDFADHPVPTGFGKDVCSTKALKALKVSDGKVVAPSGARYEMLVLQDVSEMSSATLEAVERLVESGATVVAPRMPTRAPGLWHYPHGDAEVRSRAAAIWKKGVVTGGVTDGIAALDLSPDFVCLSAPEGLTNETAWIHRRYADGSEAYFVSCPNAQTGDFRCSFRVDGFMPELWDAESGKIGLAPKDWRRVGGRTEVAFALPPSGSVFVVFRARTEIREGRQRGPQTPVEWREIHPGWRVTFPVGWYEGGTEAKTVQMDSLVDWTTVKDDDIRYFSGTACYEAEIPDAVLSPALLAKKEGRRVVLDLGEVRDFAEVAVNGQSYPALWRPPYRVDVTEALAERQNKLVVRVTNLWPNRMIGDERLCAPDCEWTASGGLKELPAFIREGRSSPTGRKTFATWRHWKKDDKLLPSGLLGPVRFADADDDPSSGNGGGRRQLGVPFSALRFGYRFTQPDKWPEMRTALEKNLGAFDEVWFSTGVSFPPLGWHEEHARQCAAAAADLRRIGIVPSLEIQTIIGHTDAILSEGDCTGQDWGTMVSADGIAAARLSCPRDPRLVAYFTRVAELHAAWKPGSVWVDDDMSYRNRAPLLDPENNLPGCFCDRCIAGFSAAEGRQWERAELVRRIRADESVRRRWDDYSCEGFAAVNRAIAAAVHRASPETVMGYQYGGQLRPAIPRGLFDGSGLSVRLRPGAGAYWDRDPYLQLGKAYALQRMLKGVRGEKWVGACCPEIETCPRTFACRTAQGIVLEAFENLALGMDSLSMFVADARTDESTGFYADRLFPRLKDAHSFLKGYRDANVGTTPCGFSVSNDVPALLVACRGVPIVGAGGRSLGALPDLASIPIRTSGSGDVDKSSPEYQTRVMQTASSTGLLEYYGRCDRASGGRLPVRFGRPVMAFAMPRVRDDGSLATLAVVNASIDRQESVEVLLRGVGEGVATAVWHEPESPPVEIPVAHVGPSARVLLPRMGAWSCGYLAVPRDPGRPASAAASADSADVKLPGEPSYKPAISPAPFPDRMSAYVWRNWFLVPHARLADVVGAKESDLAAAAREMGLPESPEILPEWRRRGYITVLRRNWHLLDYPQLMALLDMTREELRFSLVEDDFLFVKLGGVKPKCGPLKWDGAAVAATRPARREIARILRMEGADDFSEEPRFKFVKELSAVDHGLQARKGGQSPFDLRLISSYFADYGDPLWDAELSSFPEGLLQKLADQGVNAVWLHTVLRTLAKDPKYPEFGEGSERRMANLRKLVARCAKYGIKVYLYMNEPRGMPDEFFRADPSREAIRGAEDRSLKLCAMCTSVPEVRRWVRDSLEKVFRGAPGLGGIFTITMSENLTNCASRGGKKGCVRCRDRDSSEIVAEINAAMIEGMAAGNPEATALVWDWGWARTDGGAEKIVPLLPKKNIRLMGVSEAAMEFERGGVKSSVADYSISVVGPGQRTKELWRIARENGIPTTAKVQANCSWEMSAFPYLPVADLVAEHALNLVREGVDGVMLAWSVGSCPAPNISVFREIRRDDPDKYAVLSRVAAELYGAEAVPAVREAWYSFAEGFREYPFSIGVAYKGPQQWGSATPLYVEPTGYFATMVGLPYDDIVRWCDRYPPDVWVGQMEKVRDGFIRGCVQFEGAISMMLPERRAAARRELNMYRAETLHFRSCADLVRFVQARNRGDRPAMAAIARRELEAAKQLLVLVRGDSRFGYESSNHYFYVPQDLREKILSCHAAIKAAREGMSPGGM